ncbi:MAG: translation initiation factor [Bacteroidetes bacterium]|jgi:translation initiation factor 1|nr:translation initiation factor [Bacteroidota bacterium]
MAKDKPQKRAIQDLSSLGGLVYSTHAHELEPAAQDEGLVTHPSHVPLYVSRDKKGRAGKQATVVDGFEGSEDLLGELCKTLKQKCGVGGTFKDGTIIIQGDKRTQVMETLKELGYKVKQKGG